MSTNDDLIQPSDPQWFKNAARDMARPKADADGAAIAGLILAFLFAPLGFTFGMVSRGQARRHGMRQSSVATGAIILGGLFTVIAVIWIIVAITAAAKTGTYDACVSSAINSGVDPSLVCTP